MKIYKAEQSDGLLDILNKSFANIQCKFTISNKNSFEDLLRELSLAENINYVKDLIGQDQQDLAFISSILVSAGWNLNDDIFIPIELWKARYTPKHKPINNEHNDTEILGHIIESRAVDKGGKEIILSESDIIPDEFDIEVAGVLYKSLPQLKDKITNIIEKANKGELFVSMECWFDDLAYGIVDSSSGKTTVIERKEETAFLTKHLKAYGGTGEFKGFKVGRILKNIVFGGQGLVKNPANPESVIKIAANLEGGAKKMDEATKKQLDEALANSANKDKQIESLAKDLEASKAQTNMFETKVKEYDAEIKKFLSQLSTAAEDIKGLESEKDELTKKLEEVTANFNKVNDELAKITKANVTKERIEKLSKVKDLSEAEIKEVAEMSDDTFNAVLKYASINTEKKETKKEEEVTASVKVETNEEPVFQGGNDDVEDKSAEIAQATARCLLGINKEEGGE